MEQCNRAGTMNLDRLWPWKEFRRLEDELAHKDSEIRMHRDTICSLEQQLGDHVKLNAEKDKHLRKLGAILAMTKGIAVLFMCLCANIIQAQPIDRYLMDTNILSVTTAFGTFQYVTTPGGQTNLATRYVFTNNVPTAFNSHPVDVPHGFPFQPYVTASLLCTNTAPVATSAGYLAGDEIPHTYAVGATATPRQLIVVGVNTTNIWVTIGNGSAFVLPPKTNSVSGILVPDSQTNWVVKVYVQ